MKNTKAVLVSVAFLAGNIVLALWAGLINAHDAKQVLLAASFSGLMISLIYALESR